jgi:Tfp pilus assembly protein PilO
MEIKTPEKKQLIILAVGIALIIGVGCFRCKPLLARAKHLKMTRSNQMIENTNIRKQMLELPIVGEKMKKLRSEIGEYYDKIPRNRDFAALWEQIADMMKSLNLKDQLIQPDQEVLGSEINSISVTIKCSGSFSQLYEFFKLLEDFDRVVRIEQLKLTGSQNDSGLVKMDAKAKIYYQFANQEKTKV